MEHIGTYLEIAVLTIYGIYKWLKKRSETKERAEYKLNHSQATVEEIDRRVKHETRKIRDRYMAIRCYIIHFSNGTVTDIGLPLRKITFKHEAYIDWGDHAVLPVSKDFQESDTPVMFSSSMAITFKIGEYYLKNIEELKDIESASSREYYHWLESYGVKSTLWLGIYKKGEVSAIMVCHWPQPTDISGKIKSDILQIKRNIEKVYSELK